MNIAVDIDNTICITHEDSGPDKYEKSTPIAWRIDYINKLYDDGNKITYWTARGNASGVDYSELTKSQLSMWGCKYHELVFKKPSFDILIDDKTMHPNFIPKSVSKKSTSEVVKKGWGEEIVFVNNDKYCGKILRFNKGAKFSMHFHLEKQETWYVASGKFLLKFVDLTNADMCEESLNPGDTVTNMVGEPHQIVCIEAGDIFEVSTHHEDCDSFRIGKGDSQKI